MARSVYCSPSSFPVRFHYKQRKIKVSSQSGSNIHRGSFHVGKGSSVSNSRMSSRPESSSLAASPVSEYSIPLSSSAGKDSTLSGTDSKCQTIHETNSAASVTKLESNKTAYDLSNSCYTFAQAIFEMVVTGSKYFEGSICSTNTIYGNNNNRCKSVWLG